MKKIVSTKLLVVLFLGFLLPQVSEAQSVAKEEISTKINIFSKNLTIPVGEAQQLTITVQPSGDWVVNPSGENKLELARPLLEGLYVSKTLFQGKDLQITEGKITVEVPFTGQRVGSYTIQGEMTLSLCENTCPPTKEKPESLVKAHFEFTVTVIERPVT